MESSLRPHQSWTRIDIEPDASFVFPPSLTTTDDAHEITGRSKQNYCLYGPGELELYYHFQLLHNVGRAKINVWYPGSWRTYSTRACFRAKLTSPIGVPSDDDDEFGRILLKFRSNARIVVAMIKAGEENYPLLWKSTERASSSTNHGRGERIYYHVVHAPPSSKIDDNHTKCAFDIVLTLDSTRADDLTKDDEFMVPPPCISLTSSHPFSPTTWEWNSAAIGDEELTPITSYWITNDAKSINSDNDCTNTLSWRFPQQVEDLSQISAVLPTKRLSLRDGGEIIVMNDHPSDEYSRKGNEIVYDFDKELLGKVLIKMPMRHLRPALLTIRVGETWVEMMNDVENHLEQCVDLSYSLERETHTWLSQHLLAFRYLRIILSKDDVVRWDDIAVECEVHMPLLYHCGTFSSFSTCTDESNTECELDSRTAEYTLQLCTHHNFIVDGVKRDRLPWGMVKRNRLILEG